MSAHLRIGRDEDRRFVFAVVDDLDQWTELIGQRTVKVRCPNRRLRRRGRRRRALRLLQPLARPRRGRA